MRTINLKTETEEQMLDVLRESGFSFADDGELITATHYYFISVIGTIYQPTGALLDDGEGGEYPEKAPVDGHHANLVTSQQSLIAGVKNITIEVSTPECVIG